MTWQDYAVWVIGLAVAALLARRLWCLIKGRKNGGCGGCGSMGCPLHGIKRKK